MINIPTDEQLYERLAGRIGAAHVRRRLGLESDREAWVMGQGRQFIHLENWYSIHGMIRGALRVALLHTRAKRNALKIRVHEHEVRIPHLPIAFDGFRILQLSDLHLDMNPEFPHVLSERVRGIDYDACVLTGDYRYLTFGGIEAALAGMQRVRVHLPDPVYGILGNHDSIRMVPPMEDMGISMLVNEAAEIRRGTDVLRIVGIDDPHYYRTDNLDRACTNFNHGDVAILLAHTPEVFRQAAHTGFSLMLCGHTHGGQICLPGGIPIIYDAACPRRYAKGTWRHHQMIGYTSVGAGSSIVDVRLNCPPEVTLHRLRRA